MFLNVPHLPLNPSACLQPASSVLLLVCPLQVLFNQFKYFFNLYFLLLACSQFVPEMRLGALYTYWVPLVSIWTHQRVGNRKFFASLLQASEAGRWPFRGEDALRPARWESPRFAC